MSAEEAAAATANPPAAEAEEAKPEAAAEAGDSDADKVADALEKVGVSGEKLFYFYFIFSFPQTEQNARTLAAPSPRIA